MKPIIAIVGRPNVGKSTLFNRLVGTRQAIVDPTPGVTRDRLYADAEWRGQVFTLVDTGGFEPLLEEEIPRKVREQAEQAIDEADLIMFVVDGRAGSGDHRHRSRSDFAPHPEAVAPGGE